MSISLSLTRRTSRGVHRRRERGVVLFIALLVMVALSLAGIALLRSSDTATTVAGNLAFKQAAAAAVDRSVEQAVQVLFDPQPDHTIGPLALADKTAHLTAQNYYACVLRTGGGAPACLLAGNAIPEVPTMLETKTCLALGLVPDDAGGNKTYYVIERMCANPGAAFGNNCNLSSAALGADAGTPHYDPLSRVGDAFYRVTIRVDGPRNTVVYAQAFLQ